MGAPSGSRKSLFLLTYFLSCAVVANEAARAKLPNILFVLMDDLGWNDVGFRNNEFHTPTIDDLYSEGIRFNNSYTTPNCGPSRAALLSGIYPYKMGLQGSAINSRSPAAIPGHKVLLPQKLQQLGYQTHLVGKWHQGFCKRAQTPTYRGFDSFFGFYLTKQDHYTHRFRGDAYDFRSNLKVDRSVEGQYSTHVYTERTRQLISDYKEHVTLYGEDTKPFFILLSYAAIHSPNQVPQHYIDEYCSAIEDPERQKKCGMMAAVDEGLKNITDDLQDLKLMDDVLIVFTSDDGGSVNQGSSNWPLRGSKRTLWEGGIRVNTFLYSKSKEILPRRRFTYEGLFYITDFYATLVGLVQNNTGSKKLNKISHSYNQWRFLQEARKQGSNRRWFAYVDQSLGVAMLRYKNWKLLYMQSRQPGWYNPPSGEEAPKGTDPDKYQLFDLNSDPTETTDVKAERTELFDFLVKMLRRVRAKAEKPIDIELPSSPPRSKGVWSHDWCAPEEEKEEENDDEEEEEEEEEEQQLV